LGVTSLWIPWLGYNPPTLGFVLYALLFVFIAMPTNGIKARLIALLLFAPLILAHALTATAMVLSILLALVILGKGNMRIFGAILASMFFAWYFYVLPTISRSGISILYNGIQSLDLTQILGSNIGTGQLLTMRLKLIYATYLLGFAVFFFLLLYAVIRIHARRKISPTHERTLAGISFFWILGLAPLMVVQYGFEMLLRLYLFSIPPILLLFFLAKPSMKVLTITFLVLAVLHMPAHYNGEALGIAAFSPELQGSSFFALRIEPGATYVYRGWYLVLFHNPDLVATPAFQIGPSSDMSVLKDAKYIISSRLTHSYFLLHSDRDVIEEWIALDSTFVERTYDNGGFVIFTTFRW